MGIGLYADSVFGRRSDAFAVDHVPQLVLPLLYRCTNTRLNGLYGYVINLN